MRQLMLSVALVALAGLGLGAFVVPAGAGANPHATTMIVRKSISGPATAGSTVVVACTGGEEGGATLTFDATGAPLTASNGAFVKANGAWVFEETLPSDLTQCTFTETVTGGAASTSWTCAFESTAPEVPKGQAVVEPDPGCAAASGTGTGPATVVLGNISDNILTQTATITFTNTFVAPPPPPINTAPAFTG